MECTDADYYSDRLIEKLKSLDVKHKLDFGLIHKAIDWAKKYHGDQLRKSGEPFYTHPLEVAYIICDYDLKTDVIVTSILHDIIEDTEVTVEMILATFGARIAEMVDRLTRDRPDGTKLSVAEVLNNAYQKKEKEVLLIKLIDRLHNITTLDALPFEKQLEETRDTLDLFLVFSAYLEKTTLEKELAILCHNIVSTEKEKRQIQSLYSFLEESDDSYQLPSLD